MLNKKEVVAWTERQEAAAMDTAKSRFQMLIETEKERLLVECGAAEQIKRMQKTVSKLCAENEVLNELLDTAKSVMYEKLAYSGLTKRLGDMENLRSAIMPYAKFDSELILKIKREQDETFRNIRATYAAVYAELRNKKNARHCLDYLKELGFDVSELERLEHTEIAVAVDKRYLFIKNEQERQIKQ